MNTKQPRALVLAKDLELNHIYCPEEVLIEAAAELRRLHQYEPALNEWLDKTDWVQDTAKPGELGMHRADVLKQRIDRLVNTLAEAHTTYQAKLLADEALLRQTVAAQAKPPRIPDWISYDQTTDVLTIHGRRYSAALFDERGFGLPPGTLLRIVDGPAEVVTLEKVTT